VVAQVFKPSTAKKKQIIDKLREEDRRHRKTTDQPSKVVSKPGT
jgi:hypothetical protein